MMYVGRFFLSLFLFVSALLATGCGRQPFSADFIPDAAGRFSAVTSAYPGVVMVIAPGGQGLCTGSIISRYAVLTAAHCVLRSGDYTVRTRSGDFRTSTKRLNGPGTVNDTQDIAVLIFNQEITQNDDDIYAFSNQIAQGDAVKIVGFGCNSIETTQGAGVKRAGTNRLAEKGSDFLRLLTPKRTERGIIGDANQAGTCFGDSGGPMFRISGDQLHIAGVTHAGGSYSTFYVSEFVNVADRAGNRNFLASVANQFGLSFAGI